MSNNKSNALAKKVIDFILLSSLLSPVVIWGLIKFNIINETNARWIFLPGYSLMIIMFLMARISMIDIHEGGKDDNSNNDVL